MKASKPLQSVVKFTESQEQNAANLLAEQLKQLEVSKTKLADLLTYRDEYQRQLLTESLAGIAVSRMIDFQGFMANLSQAIDQQKTAIEAIKLCYKDKKRQWLAAHQRSNAIDTVVTRHQAIELEQENRQLQKEMDDRSIRYKIADDS